MIPGGPAEAAGLVGFRTTGDGRLVLGDIIVGMAGQDIRDVNDLYKVLDNHRVGDSIDVVVRREQERRTVKITLIDVSGK